MGVRDWLALSIVLGFVIIGNLTPWRRRARVVFLIALFLGLYLLPWIAGIRLGQFVIPFGYYNLYSILAPESQGYGEVVMVGRDGREYPVDFRVWQPFIPRSFNFILRRRLTDQTVSREKDRIGRTLVKRVKEALRHHHRPGGFDGWNAYLLGHFHYPEHQTAAVLWAPDAKLPQPEEVCGVRIYWIQYQTSERREDPARYTRTLLHEFPA
jgi:hypothetical protein